MIGVCGLGANGAADAGAAGRNELTIVMAHATIKVRIILSSLRVGLMIRLFDDCCDELAMKD